MPQQQPGFGPVHSFNQPPANPYDFILNPAKPHHGTWFIHASMKMRVMIVAGVFIVLLVIALLFTSLLANSGSDTSPFLNIAQRQTELSRVSRNALTQTTQQSTRGLATTIRLSLITDRAAVITYLDARGKKPSADDLSKLASASTDQQLDNARSQGIYDATYVAIVRQALQAYQQALKQTYAASGRSDERQLLQTDYNHAQLLLELANVTH